jgi:putative OPT family oligopeptide transporter
MNHEPSKTDGDKPVITGSRSLPEITIKAVILGVILSAVLAAANAYVGLFVGMTVSASIPAAVVSMALLRWFRNSNILENNIVQTSASAGESLAAGVIFTIPALILMGAWDRFDYWETTMIAGLGGVIGVLFTIPLRRALIIENPLKFPEGIATAEVLKTGEGGGGIKYLVAGGLVGGIAKLFTTAFKVVHETYETARFMGGSIGYFGTYLSPMLVAVGYIVGFNISILMFLGGALNWYVAIPLIARTMEVDADSDPLKLAKTIWEDETRYLGVGAMVIGGVWALIQMRKSLIGGIRTSVAAYRAGTQRSSESVDRTERDAPMQWVAIALVIALIPLYFVFERASDSFWIGAVMAVLMLIAGFLFSAVAGYMAGLVGSSNNPISGMTIATILTSSLLLFVMGLDSKIGPPAAIMIGGVVCCAAAIAGDNMQDLKAGRLVGATPYKQQIMQVIGVVAAAAVIAPVLQVILQAYGIGEATEKHPNALAAPQAKLMASVARGVFQGGLPWTMVAIGAAVAVVVIIMDQILALWKSSFRMPVLAVAVGIYLPLSLSVPILFGGIAALIVAKMRGVRGRAEATHGSGLLFGAGLITGEALVGIALAVPIVLFKDGDVLAMKNFTAVAWPGILWLVAVVAAFLFLDGRAKATADNA